jgi:hypothetical protein
MEILEFITVLSVLGVVSGTVIVMLIRVIPRKTTKRVAEDSVTRLINANSRLTEEYEQRQKALNKSLQSENQRLRKELGGEGEEEEEEQIPPELLAPIAQKLNMKPDQMAQLLASPQVKKLLKGNKDLLPLLPTLLGGLGGQQNQQSNQYPQGMV